MSEPLVATRLPAKRVSGSGYAQLWLALATVTAAQVAVAAAVPLLPEEAYHWAFAATPTGATSITPR